jgi:hypothetical protein
LLLFALRFLLIRKDGRSLVRSAVLGGNGRGKHSFSLVYVEIEDSPLRICLQELDAELSLELYRHCSTIKIELLPYDRVDQEVSVSHRGSNEFLRFVLKWISDRLMRVGKGFGVDVRSLLRRRPAPNFFGIPIFRFIGLIFLGRRQIGIPRSLSFLESRREKVGVFALRSDLFDYIFEI